MKPRYFFLALLLIAVVWGTAYARQDSARLPHTPRVPETAASDVWISDISPWVTMTPDGTPPAASVQQPERPAQLMDVPDDQDDPSAKMYKEGYSLIMDEEWDSARKKLEEMVAKYPKSKHGDEAKYWIAYSLKHTDKKKAKESYRQFLKDYPKSKYYDDAVADLNDLEANWVVYTAPSDSGKKVTVVGGKSGNALSLSWTPERNARQQYRMTRQLQKSLRVMQPRPNLGVPIKVPKVIVMPYSSLGALAGDEDVDEETRLKMDVLYALGDTKEDSVSYQTLRDVAVDRKQPRQLRNAAMDALSGFKKFEVLPVFIEIAKTDTSEEIQAAAIDYIGQLSKNKNKSVDALTELFNSIPKHRHEQLETVLNSIAEIGNDKAIDFLAGIARSHENYDLRSQAVYYLGNIGGDKAREALYEVLKAK